MRIRAERDTDAEAGAVAALHVAAWRAAYAGIMPEPFLAGLDPGSWAQRRRAQRGGPFHALLAEDGPGLVAGFVTVGPYRVDQDRTNLDQRYGEILAIYVAPERWGDGVGRRLLAAGRAELARQGYAEVRLWVLAANARARRFYERAGLRPDGEQASVRLDRWGGPPVSLPELRYAGAVGASTRTSGDGRGADAASA